VDASKTYLYMFDNYIAHLVDGVDAGAHKHGAYQLSSGLIYGSAVDAKVIADHILTANSLRP